ncbi:transposase domain-containing protein [Streptomyces pathocidini]|uniref:Transposase domain-containing protein n=1 Tax=Streptomyces pathocidini TaxID=1650571 RepID=A0ABW7UXY5_9ACTN|nr:transposase domain-containing protein [Streptomyces pathocidini]
MSRRFMVYFTLGLALFAQDLYDDIAENLVGALDWDARVGTEPGLVHQDTAAAAAAAGA